MLPSAVSDSRVHNILPNKIETDFQFSRASAATRVNHQGLIENVGYFSDELVRNGNFSELGPELITNGDFATDSDWTKGDGWSIINGKAVANNVTNNLLSQTGISFIANKTYKLVYTISDYVSGSIRPQLSGGGNPVQNLNPTINSNGTFTRYFVADAASTNFRFKGFTNFTGKIDNVSVKQVDPNDRWFSLGTGWSFGDGVVSSDGSQSTNSDCTQNMTTDAGKTYKITYTISEYSAGGVFIRLASGNVTTTQTSAGTFSENLSAIGGTQIRIRANSTFVGTISNISVVEVIGDKPRLDYDPLNPTCPHLLLEPQSTNYFKFSEDFVQSYWSKSNCTVQQSTITSPDGSQSSYKLIPDAGTGGNRSLGRSLTSLSNLHTFSVFAKKDELRYLFLRMRNNPNQMAVFDLEDGVISATSPSPTQLVANSAKIEDYGNGWFRCSATFDPSQSNNVGQLYPSFSADNTGALTSSFDGDGVSGIYLFGAQLEQQDYVTSYIPTAGATETRVQETCVSAGNLNTFNNSEGTIYAEIAGLVSSTTLRSIGISDGTSANRVNISLWKNGGNDQLLNFVGLSGVSQCNFFGAVNSILEFNKVAFNYKQNDFKMYINGVLVGTDTSGNTFPADTLIKFNFDRGEGSTRFFGKTKSLATYNRALTDNELYTITSTQYSAYSGMVAALGNYTIPC